MPTQCLSSPAHISFCLTTLGARMVCKPVVGSADPHFSSFPNEFAGYLSSPSDQVVSFGMPQWCDDIPSKETAAIKFPLLATSRKRHASNGNVDPRRSSGICSGTEHYASGTCPPSGGQS